MEEIEIRILEEHLPYELDMLEGAFAVLYVAEFAELRKIRSSKKRDDRMFLDPRPEHC